MSELPGATGKTRRAILLDRGRAKKRVNCRSHMEPDVAQRPFTLDLLNRVTVKDRGRCRWIPVGGAGLTVIDPKREHPRALFMAEERLRRIKIQTKIT